jgi:thymidylate kinase
MILVPHPLHERLRDQDHDRGDRAVTAGADEPCDDRPDLAVILNADPTVLAARMTERGSTHSRFERLPDGAAAQSRLYRDTTARLSALGWLTCDIDTTACAFAIA